MMAGLNLVGFFVVGVFLDRCSVAFLRIARWVLRGPPGARCNLANPPFYFAPKVIDCDSQNLNVFLELHYLASQIFHDLFKAGHVSRAARRHFLGRRHRRKMLAEIIHVVKALSKRRPSRERLQIFTKCCGERESRFLSCVTLTERIDRGDARRDAA